MDKKRQNITECQKERRKLPLKIYVGENVSFARHKRRKVFDKKVIYFINF